MSIEEIGTQFCWNTHRERLYQAWLYWIHEIEPAKESINLHVFGSFVTRRADPKDIDCLVVITQRTASLDCLKRLELWTMQGVTSRQPNMRNVSRIQPLVGLVDAHFAIEDNLKNYQEWIETIATSRTGKPCGFVTVTL